MEVVERPAWVTRVENGAIAEARTRSFLLDRFWLLERSIDLEGADLIVQRRLTTQSLLDRTPPQLGYYVQAKFYANAKTTHYVHREYVVDGDAPRPEFFVVCHTGTEGSAHAYFLTASDIVDNFKLTSDAHSRPDCYAMPGAVLLAQRFEIVDRGRVLDAIERALRDADFYRNRTFLSWAMPRIPEEHPPILPMYEESIDNWWGDIPEGFSKVRDAARRAQWDVREALEMLCEIETSNDPERCQELAEELWHNWGNRVTLPDDIYDPELYKAVLHHKRRYEELCGSGLLGAHAALRRTALEMITEHVDRVMPLRRDQVLTVGIRYDPRTLLNVSLDFALVSAASLWEGGPEDGWHFESVPDTRGVLQAAPGHVEIYLVPGVYLHWHCEHGEWTVDSGPWTDQLAWAVEGTVGMMCEEILGLRFET